MFIGHFGVGFGAKKAAPAVSLGTLFLGAQFVDLLWPILLLLNVEHVAIRPGISAVTPLDFYDYPISHSLVMGIVWSVVVGAIYWLIRKNGRGAIVLGLCVISHWLLDLIVHIPDLPLYPGAASPLLGFGLWNSRVATVIIEGAIFIVGVSLYLQTTRARNTAGRIGLWVLILLLVAVYVVNVIGTPPPDVTAIAWAGQLQWIFVILAYWVDHNRIAVKNIAREVVPEVS